MLEIQPFNDFCEGLAFSAGMLLEGAVRLCDESSCLSNSWTHLSCGMENSGCLSNQIPPLRSDWMSQCSVKRPLWCETLKPERFAGAVAPQMKSRRSSRLLLLALIIHLRCEAVEVALVAVATRLFGLRHRRFDDEAHFLMSILHGCIIFSSGRGFFWYHSLMRSMTRSAKSSRLATPHLLNDEWRIAWTHCGVAMALSPNALAMIIS